MGQELKLSNIQISQSGNYTCIAHNKQSLRYSVSQLISVTVLDKGNAGGDGDSLSAGAIAGIVIGVLLGVAGIAGLTFYFVKVKETPKTNSRGNNQSGATHNAGGHDSYYENMVRFQNQNPGVNEGGSDTQMHHAPHPVKPPYEGRASLDTTTLALELRSLTESDTGQYFLIIETALESFTGQTSLQVLVPVSSVTVVPSQTELVEFNSSVSFVCSTSGSSLSFIWLNGSSEITAGERVQLTDNNSSLTITSVIRGDTGPYECEASNSISRKKSLPLSLIIYYGPENVAAAAYPVGPSYSFGSNLKLTCSAESRPAAEFQWAVNGTELGEMGQELKLSNIQISQSGNYTCIAHNKQSLRYSVSQLISVTVLDPVDTGGHGDSLSAGAIAGIVIGVLLGVAAIAGLIFYFTKGKQTSRTTSRENKQNGATPNNGQHELHYADVRHLRNNQGKPGMSATGTAPTPSYVARPNTTQRKKEELKMQLEVYINLLLTITGLVQVVTAGTPQRVTISGPAEVVAGVSTIYECSAFCTTTCYYTWNVKEQSFAGSKLTLNENGVDNFISITCTVTDKDHNHFVSEVISVTVINPISVKPSTNQSVFNQQPKVGRSFHLTCNGASLPVTITWLKDDAPLTLDSSMSLSPDNVTLSFNLLKESDSGQYQCKVLNGSASVISKAYWIYLGYVIINLTGPNYAEVGMQSEYTCDARCGMDCTVQWALHAGFPRGRFIAEGPRILWTPSDIGQTQVFTCITLNPGAGNIGQVSKTVTIVEARPRPKPSNAVSAKPSVAVAVGGNVTLTLNPLMNITIGNWLFNGNVLLIWYPNQFIANENYKGRISFNLSTNQITLYSVQLSDSGLYKLQGMAPNVNVELTQSVQVPVMNVSLTVSKTNLVEFNGSVVFTCTASGTPLTITCQYSWFFQGSKVAEGSVYQGYSVSLNSSGEYTCLAHNNITGGNSSAIWNLTVIVGISSVVVTPSTLTPLASKDMQLFCNVTGSFDSIQWIKDNQPLNTAATKSMYINGTTVDFHPLQIPDNGSYKCVATDAFRPHVSLPYSLIVNYGPVEVTITVDIMAANILICNAKSQPPSVYHWLFNNTVIKEDAILILPLMPPLGYNYTCVAINPLTNDTLSASYVISERNAAAPLQTSMLLTALCALVLPLLMSMKPF
ncbi:hypothetical protein QTP70_019753 [Hemibagrus guttatus]|uniref:Ig-like domain-containing protein n=1 Tax=Hemibagrus guttatus TaxID=175788 RepID=A0AAE0VAA5_9TELE|nr:hypothetical protein QTP70_019753 [Hemibagrus guttatus]